MSKRDLRKSLPDFLKNDNIINKQKDCEVLSKTFETKQNELKKIEDDVSSKLIKINKAQDEINAAAKELDSLNEKFRDLFKNYLNEKGLPESYMELAGSIRVNDIESIISELEKASLEDEELLSKLISYGEEAKREVRGKII